MSGRAAGAASVLVAGLILCGCATREQVARQRAGSTGSPQATARPSVVTRCPSSVTLRDGAADGRSWTFPNEATATPLSGDLRRFDIRATAAGLCARFTVAGTLRAGTDLVLAIHGPWLHTPGGARISHGYGFTLRLRPQGAGLVTFGLDRPGSRAPRVLNARVSWAGNAASLVIARSELDRAPANMPDRPAFPYRRFGFQARVITPPAADRSQSVDFAPGERDGEAGYVNGQLCPAPCRALGTP